MSESVNEIDLDVLLSEEFEDDNEKQALEKTTENKNEEQKDINELLVNPEINEEELDDVQKEMFDVIQDTDKSAWEKGEGIKCKFEKLVDVMNGIQSGLGFVGAQSNMGKSGFLLEVGYSASKVDDVYSLYFSLDDSARDLLPRIVAADKCIPINSIRMPETFSEYPKILKRRKEGIKELYDCIDRFKMIDQSYGNSIEFIEETIKRHHNYLKNNDINKKLFVQIDNFHDISVEDKNFYDDNDKCEFVAKRLNMLAEIYKIPIWCTAELRKSANNRRPKMGDIKAATKIGYIAKLCMMCYNEVSVEKGNSEVYYINEDRPGKSPIFEVHFDKNKLSSFKGRLYYEFIPEYALYEECTEEDMEKYNNKVYQNG